MLKIFPSEHIVVSPDRLLELELQDFLGASSAKQVHQSKTGIACEEFIGYTTSLVETDHISSIPVTSHSMAERAISESQICKRRLPRREQLEDLIQGGDEKSKLSLDRTPPNFRDVNFTQIRSRSWVSIPNLAGSLPLVNLLFPLGNLPRPTFSRPKLVRLESSHASQPGKKAVPLCLEVPSR